MTDTDLIAHVAQAIDAACIAYSKSQAGLNLRKWDTPGEVMARAAIAALRAGAEPFAWVDKLEWHKPAHRAVMASVKLGGWMSAALDDPAVCEAMKADIREWFSAGEPLETLGAALTFFRAQVEPVDRNTVIEECAVAARDALVACEWSPHDNDEQIYDVLAAILNMKEPSHTVSEREAITAWLLSDGARLDYEASGSEEHFSWWAADAIGRGEHMKEPSQ